MQVRLGLGGEPPIVVWAIEELHEARRDVDPHRNVGWPGFQQQQLRSRILGEPVGYYTAGRAAADNDVVVISHGLSPGGEDYCERSARDRSALTATVTWLGRADR